MEDEDFKIVINSLKNLRKIEAPDNFEADLIRKINSPQAEKQKSLFELIFSPVKLIPSAALVATAVILIFVVNNHSTEIENPFSIEPRMREDILLSTAPSTYSSESSDKLKKDTNLKTNSEKKTSSDSKLLEKTNSGATSIITEDSQLMPGKNEEEYFPDKNELVTSSNSTKDVNNSDIPKSNLNFKQIRLTDSSRLEVAKLKEKVGKYLKIEKKDGRKAD